LDGTLNYSRSISINCISIGLWDGNKPLLGVIYDFIHDSIFTGIVGESAKLNGETIFTSNITNKKNAILCTTGSLGHGFPIAAGMAFAKKKLKKSGNIFVLISDGECQEGTTWETMLIASKHKLNNLILIIDYNKIQALSKLEDALPLHNLSKKIKSFNWNCLEVKNGHSFKELIPKFSKKFRNTLPTAIIVNTIKGKGIKKFENDPSWHARKLQGSELEYGKKILGIK